MKPMLLSRRQLRPRARKIKLLLMDVDGVLTDGRIYYLPKPNGGFFETKTFHARDGIGIRYASAAGIKTGIISGRATPAVAHRAKELGIDFVEEGALEKIPPYLRILSAAGVEEAEVCYVGDDLVDLPILSRVGLAVGVRDCDDTVRAYVHYLTRRRGGRGAVRETVELILGAQGKWQGVVERYRRAGREAVIQVKA